MGSKDVMTTFAERDIRQYFSEFDGWNCAPITGVQSPAGLYRASRNRSYHDEVAFIAVSFDQIPENECITALDALPSSRGSRVKMVLLTPQASDISLVPPHVQILQRLPRISWSAGPASAHSSSEQEHHQPESPEKYRG